MKDRHLLLKNWLWEMILETNDFWDWEINNYKLKKAFIEDGKKALKELRNESGLQEGKGPESRTSVREDAG